MLSKLRESAHGFFGKVLLIVLVVSFGIWGIGDILRTGDGGRNVVATVGKTPISVQEFGQALRSRQEELQQRLGAAYTPELLKKIHLDVMVRTELINNHLINNEAEALGLIASDDDVAKMIGQDPNFLGKDGKFDKDTYVAVLRNRGVAEQKFVSDLRTTLSAQLLVNILISNIIVPDDMVNAIYKAREEQRSANLFVVTPVVLKSVPQPSDSDVKAYYDSNSKAFLTPEYRSVSYVDLKLPEIQAKVDVSEDEIKQAYTERQQDYQAPERRQIDQMVFASQEDALKAYGLLAQGGNFDAVAKTANITNKGKTSVGLMGKQDLPAEEADSVFDLKEGGVTKPFKSEFGWHLFHVSKIVPSAPMPLAEARGAIIKELSAAKALDTVTRLTNQIEDDLAGGKSFEDAVAKVGFKLASVKDVSRDGHMPDGKTAVYPNYSNFLDTAFSYNEKEHSQAVEAADGSYFILRVDAVTPEHVRPLAEVKDSIIATLKAQRTAEQLQKTATAIAEALRKGKTPDVSIAPIPSGNLKSDSATTEDKKTDLPRGMVLELFNIQPHGYTGAYKSAGDSYVIAALDKVTPAPANPDPKVLELIKKDLLQSLQHEVISDYLTYLRHKYPISVNASFSAAGDDSGQE